MKRLGSFLLVGIALTCALGFGADRAGVALPFGIHVPGAELEADEPDTTQVTVGTTYFEGAGTDRSVVVGNGGTARLTAGYGLQFSGADASPAAVLQRRVEGGRWQRTSAPVLFPSGRPMTVVTPVYAASGATASVDYRIVSGASASRVMTVVYENQRRYTGMAATVYEDLRRWCPTTAVHVQQLHGREAGDYRTGAQLIRIDETVGRTTVLEPIDIRALAVHECSHERQWLNYGATAAGRTAMTAAAAKWFTVAGSGVDPVEHAADCGAQSVNPGGYMGYGGSCTTAALREGRRLLRGDRY